MIIVTSIFWISIFVVIHSYVLYPFFLYVVSKHKKENIVVYSRDENLPRVSVVMAVYNEESVIEEKLWSIFRTNYPKELLDVYVGSDNSSDSTDDIVRKFAQNNPNVHLVRFNKRTGKPQIVNELVASVDTDLLLMTDANVFFEENTIFELVKHFKNENIQAVGALIKNYNEKKSGISVQEKTYLMQESGIKYREALWARAVIGLFGGLYAIRKSAYCPVPEGYIVDDFYITMKVIEQKGEVITTNDAVCYEDVSNKIEEEFKRKKRISLGNFKNLSTFRNLANPFTKVGFMFLSHKIFRWFTPFFMIIIFILNFMLWNEGGIYQIALCGQVLLVCMMCFDYVFRKMNIHIGLLRFITHFFAMNAALLLGFCTYLTHKSETVWQPTKRNQD